MVSHIQRLIMLACQLLLSSQFVSDCLIDTSSTPSSLNVCRIKTPHVVFIKSYPVLIRILFWTFEHSSLLNLRMIKTIAIVSPSGINKVFLPRRYLRWVLFGFTIVPCSVRKVSLFVEGIWFMVGELVISHKFIIDYQLYYYHLTDIWSTASLVANSLTLQSRNNSEQSATTPSFTMTNSDRTKLLSLLAAAILWCHLPNTKNKKQLQLTRRWFLNTLNRIYAISDLKKPRTQLLEITFQIINLYLRTQEPN